VFEREDSLLQLIDLSDEELTKFIEEVMAEDARKREEERQRLLEALEKGGDITSIGDFWPWNPTLRETGKENFLDVWGDRKLEDDWRRSNKIAFTEFDNEDENDTTSVQDEVAPIDQGRTFEEYLADIPKGDEAISESIEKRAEARYNAGLIYKEKLDDFENAVEQFEVLVTETDNSAFHPVTHYQLYRTYLSKEQGGYSNPFCGTCNSGYWSQQTLSKYPDSEYAVLINNPEFLSMKEIKESEELEAYETVFDKYRKQRFNDVIQAYLDILNNEVKPDAEEVLKKPDLYKYRKGVGHYFVLLIPLEGGNPNPVQSAVANFNSTFFKSSGLSIKSRVLGKEYQMLYVRDFGNETDAMNYYNAFKVNQNILGDVNKANYYKFVISKSNYSALTKDREPEKYLTFFEENYLE